jgi:hypothetical protein
MVSQDAPTWQTRIGQGSAGNAGRRPCPILARRSRRGGNVIRSVSTGRTVRIFSAALVLPVLLVAGCGGKPTTAAPPPNQINQPQTNNGTPTVPPTVRTLPRPRTPSPSSDAGSSGDMVSLDQSFMPFATGRSWTYQVRSTSSGKTDEGTIQWTVDSANPDNTAVTVISNVGGQQHTVSNQVAKNADGTVTITTISDGKKQVQTVKPEEMPQGSQSQAQGPGASQGTALQGTKDPISVPAGAFEAVKIVNDLPEGKGKITAWYAPNIGMVKQLIEATTDQGPITSNMELSAYK